MEVSESGELVKRATHDVFSMMLGTELDASTPSQNRMPLSESEVTALIGLAGFKQGSISVHCTREQARSFTATLLGMDPAEVEGDSEIQDALGEIVNMIAGNVKTGIADQGVVNISLPTVVMSDKRSVHVKAPESVVVHFASPFGEFAVELVLQDGDTD